MVMVGMLLQDFKIDWGTFKGKYFHVLCLVVFVLSVEVTKLKHVLLVALPSVFPEGYVKSRDCFAVVQISHRT